MKLRWKFDAIKRILKSDNHLLITFDKRGDMQYNYTYNDEELAQIGRWLNGFHSELTSVVKEAKDILNENRDR